VRGIRHRVSTARRRALVLVTVALAGVMAVGAIGAIGAIGNPAGYVDLTTAGADIADGDARWVQGGIGAGTGNFDPFLTLSQQGNANTQKGYNTTQASGEFDTFFGGGRTHPIQLAAIPAVNLGGVLYREFSLDANDQGADDFMSIDELKVFTDDQNNLTGFNTGTNTFSNDNASKAVLKYDLGDKAVLMRSQGLTPGSGVSDITLLVKDSVFPQNCYYGSQSCGLWLYLYTNNGQLGQKAVGAGCTGTCNWNVTAGFEEWRTRLAPVVNVTKTATPASSVKYDWTVKKYVAPGACPQLDENFVDADSAAGALVVSLFNGQNGNVCWKIVSTRGAAVPVSQTVSGTVTVTNPTGAGQVITTPISATVNSLTDQIDQDGTLTNVTLSCPGITFPKALAAGESFQCTYTANVPSTTAGTNTATATLAVGGTFTGSVAFTFGAPTEEDENASLDDDRDAAGLPKTLTGTNTHTYTENVACGSTRLITNTATLTESDSGQTRTDPANVQVNCYGLTVTKNATPSFDRKFDWTVEKQVALGTCANPGTFQDDIDVALFTGQSVDVCWKIVSTRGAAQDYNFAVNGTISVQNSAPIAATGVNVSDSISDDLAATVDCDADAAGNQNTNLTIAANSTRQCTYSRSLPDKTTRLNTATATLSGQSYTGTASVNFTGVNPTDVEDEDATLDDTRFEGTFGAQPATQTYDENLACDGDQGENKNTATLTETDTSTNRTDFAQVDLTCYGLTVTKNATTTFTRTWTWDIDKSADQTSIVIQKDGSADINYEITVGTTGYTDSDWAVSGTITIQNSAPIAANGVSVADVVSNDLAATVDCDADTPGNQTTVNITANGSATCSYSRSLPNGESRTNTATATLAGTDYTGTAPVTFGAPTTKVDECVNVTDDNGTPADTSDDHDFGQVCAGDAPKTFDYTTTVNGADYECGDHTITNTATFVTGTTETEGTAEWTVELTVECPSFEGCTPGFWQGGDGSKLWNTANDPDWTAAGGMGNNPYIHTTLFNSFFNPVSSLNGLKMIDLVGTGGGSSPARRAARMVVAAYLNASFGINYQYTTLEIVAMWNAAATANTAAAYGDVQSKLGTANEAGCPL
jgi:hypothetical protein